MQASRLPISIPSSNALVLDTPRISLLASLRSISRLSSGRYPPRYAWTDLASLRETGVRRSRHPLNISSDASLVRTKAMLCMPSLTSAVSRAMASPTGLRRSPPIRQLLWLPVAALLSDGGFHSTKRFGPRGEPSLSTRSIFTPQTSSACCFGLAMVADEQINCGDDP